MRDRLLSRERYADVPTLLLPATRRRPRDIDYGLLLLVFLLSAWGIVVELLLWGVLKVSFAW